MEQSIANLPDMTELLEQGRQDCLPFESEDKLTPFDRDCITYFYWPEIQKLCQGREGVKPARYDVITKCHLLSMGNPNQVPRPTFGSGSGLQCVYTVVISL